MNLTGPHQFTRTYYDMDSKKRPNIFSQNDLGWIYNSSYGEFISPFKGNKHYSSLRKMKTLDSKKSINLEE